MFHTVVAHDISGVNLINGAAYPPPGGIVIPIPLDTIPTGTGVLSPVVQDSGITIVNTNPTTRAIDLNPTLPGTTALYYDGVHQQSGFTDANDDNVLSITKVGALPKSLIIDNLTGGDAIFRSGTSGNRMAINDTDIQINDYINNANISSLPGSGIQIDSALGLTAGVGGNNFHANTTGIGIGDGSNNFNLNSTAGGVALNIAGNDGSANDVLTADGAGYCTWVAKNNTWQVGESRTFNGSIAWNDLGTFPTGTSMFIKPATGTYAIQNVIFGAPSPTYLTGTKVTGIYDGFTAYSAVTGAGLIASVISSTWGNTTLALTLAGNVLTPIGGDLLYCYLSAGVNFTAGSHLYSLTIIRLT